MMMNLTVSNVAGTELPALASSALASIALVELPPLAPVVPCWPPVLSPSEPPETGLKLPPEEQLTMNGKTPWDISAQAIE